MVVTRSGLSRTRLQENSQQKRSVPRRIGTHLESEKESGSNGSAAESQSAEEQSSVLSRSRNSRTTGPAEIIVLISDGEASETESLASGVSSVLEVQEPIIRVTRKRRVVIAPTPKSTVRKRQKVTPRHESVGGVVPETKSNVSEVSRAVPSTESSSRNKAKSQRDSSQESETLSDAESSCSGISSLEIAPRRTARNVQKKLQFQAEKKNTKVTPGKKKQIVGMSVDSEDSDDKQAFQLSARPLSQINMPNISDNETCNNNFDDSIHRNSGKKLTTPNHQNLHIQEEKQADVSLTEVRKENCKSLDREDPTIIEEKVVTEKDSQLSLSEVQGTGLQQSLSQSHSSIPNKKHTSQPSRPDQKVLMKSLEHKFAVVKIERWNEERGSIVKKSDLAQLSNHGDSNGTPTSAGVSEEKNSQSGGVLECDTKPCKSELSVSQDIDSPVLLFLSSDESQQSDSSENERDTLCSVENSGQKEASAEDLEDTACDSALFVIDRTPGLSADKNFYLEDKAPSEVAIEEEKEEEEENSEEDSSDSDENKDESSDEEDLLNDTKSKL